MGAEWRRGLDLRVQVASKTWSNHWNDGRHAGGMTLNLRRGLVQNSSQEAPIAAPQIASRIVPQITLNPSDDFYGRNSFLVPAQGHAHYHEPDPHRLVTLAASTTFPRQDLYQLQCSSKLV